MTVRKATYLHRRSDARRVFLLLGSELAPDAQSNFARYAVHLGNVV
jgi:hypothetical protein